MRRPTKRLAIVREECRTRRGRQKLRRRMRERSFCTPSFARDLIYAAAADVTTDPAASLFLARICVQVARRSGDRCAHARSAEVLAGAHRLLGKLKLSQRTLDTAFELAKGCGCCQPMLHRALALLRFNQNQLEPALRVANRAVELTRPLKNRVEEGRSLLCRAIIRDYRGNSRPALADAEAALRVLPRDDAHFAAALHSYAVILARLGDRESVQRAEQLLPEIGKSFCGLKGLSVERAKLAWLRGEVARAQGEYHRALRQLERTRSAFIRLRMPLELAAVCADISAVLVERPWPMEAVRQVLEKSTQDPAIVFPGTLRSPLERLESATRACLEELRSAVSELRDATVALGCPPPLVTYP